MSAETFLYLETRGRKSGLPREIEIWFVALDGRYYVVAERRERAQWVRNLQAEPAVAFSIGTRNERERSVKRSTARARVVDAVSEPELGTRVRTAMDRKYDWSDGTIVEIAPEPEPHT